MKALATGWIEWNNERFEFEDIIEYQEKNWGDDSDISTVGLTRKGWIHLPKP